MSATFRTPTSAAGPNGGFFAVSQPEGVTPQTGLLAFLAADSGGFAFLSGGSDWELLARIAGPSTHLSAVDVWWKARVPADDPENYIVQIGPTADGVVAIVPIVGATGTPQVLAGSLYAGTTDVISPGGDPPSADGLEFRWAAGIPNEATISWNTPDGYQKILDLQSEDEVGGSLVWRRIYSTTPADPATHTASDSLQFGAALTVFVKSAPVVIPPDPPPFPAFTPVKGLLPMQYRVHDALTGSYRGELRTATDVTFDRRDGDAGGFSCWCPMPNRREADKLARLIPRDPADLDSGPGRLVVHPWRSGVLWGVYWLHTAEIEQSSRLGLGLRMQGTTLDGYMASVSLEEDVLFVGDQIDNARAFIAHLGQDPRSNMGFTLMPGTSGTVRELAAKIADNTTYGRVLRDYARADGGFGYVINPTVTETGIERRWVWASPQLDFPDLKVTFTQARNGGEVTGFREVRSALRGATRFGVVGGIPDGDASTERTAVRTPLIETAHLDAGWPIFDQRIIHPGNSTDMTELERYAAYYAATAAGAPRVFSADVILGRSSGFHPNMIGGQVRFVMNNDWHTPTEEGGSSFNGYQRIIGWSLTPATRTFGKDKLQVITAQAGVGS
ncbi:hypothetical protein FXF51_56725 [Nonomuraea sp. PA05]|uniref:hypothetical protein n=1 Tax=Nonomuraea sp. PA05 TaxID=2604466 RepID=UPI0011D48258|nr:hypothetical protein [Nonomuraea sp. PA05]TYB50227.1 hypothetical protein FXF51_56725 [Nonomuraea sp. PA05]